MMHFDDFVKSGRNVDSLAEALRECRDMDITSPGRIYMNSLWIERTAIGWSLLIGNIEREASDLADLERHLYNFAATEGHI